MTSNSPDCRETRREPSMTDGGKVPSPPAEQNDVLPPLVQPWSLPAFYESDIDADLLLVAAVPKEEALTWRVTVLYRDGRREPLEPMIGMVGYNLHHLDEPNQAVCWYADHHLPVYLEVARPHKGLVRVRGSRGFVYAEDGMW